MQSCEMKLFFFNGAGPIAIKATKNAQTAFQRLYKILNSKNDQTVLQMNKRKYEIEKSKKHKLLYGLNVLYSIYNITVDHALC